MALTISALSHSSFRTVARAVRLPRNCLDRTHFSVKYSHFRMLSLRLFLLFLPSVLSFKILVYNAKFAHSHSKYMGAIADTLMEAGHGVVSAIPFPIIFS